MGVGVASLAREDAIDLFLTDDSLHQRRRILYAKAVMVFPCLTSFNLKSGQRNLRSTSLQHSAYPFYFKITNSELSQSTMKSMAESHRTQAYCATFCKPTVGISELP